MSYYLLNMEVSPFSFYLFSNYVSRKIIVSLDKEEVYLKPSEAVVSILT